MVCAQELLRNCLLHRVPPLRHSVVLKNSQHEQVLIAPWNGALLAIVGSQCYSECASEEKGLVSTYASNLDTFQAIARREDSLLASAARGVGETL